MDMKLIDAYNTNKPVQNKIYYIKELILVVVVVIMLIIQLAKPNKPQIIL